MKPHISELKIEAFRGLKSVELKKLGQFSLLVGFNNSGKSSILEAIEYFCKPMDPLALISLSRRRELSTQNLDPVKTLRWLFPKVTSDSDGDFYKLEVSVKAKVGSEWRSLETTLIGRLVDVHVSRPIQSNGDPMEPTTTPPPEATFQKTAVDLKYLYYTGRTPDELFSFETSGFAVVEGLPFTMHEPVKIRPIPCVAVSPVSHRIDSTQSRGISGLVLSSRKQEMIELLQQFDSQIVTVEILDTDGFPEVWVEHKQRGFMPLSSYGDGMRRVLVIASSLAMAQGGILLIDEMETAIHKDALRDMFTWIRKASDRMNVQVIATTHSLEAIDAMLLAEEDALDEVVAYRLPRGGSKEVFTRYSGETLHDLRTLGGMEVR